MSHPDSLSVPWYKDRTSAPPFSLAKKLSSNRPSAPFRSLAFFPWTYDSLQSLRISENISQGDWNAMVDAFSDAVAVGGNRQMYLFFTRQAKNPIAYKVPSNDKDLKAIPADCMNVAWALTPGDTLEPLVLFSHLSILYIYNVKYESLSGYLRGHGGAITSIAVHPTNPNLFSTTSRDHSTRIYDLGMPPQVEQLNPHWPPATTNSLAGAAHGLHMTIPEGANIGRCIIVLMGGRSGGHQAAVLGAAFHTHFPIIATCGLDRLVKIWHIPAVYTATALIRQDKPLFSSSRIHKARVLSVIWLQEDLLLSHSAPALMKVHPDKAESKELSLEPGQLVVWRWLGLHRFFKAGFEDVHQDVLRGCASDYQESNSFKVISAVSFPLPGGKSQPIPKIQLEAPVLHLFQSPTHDPLVLFTYPSSNVIKMFNVIHLQPRKPPPFPLGGLEPVDNLELMEITDRLYLRGPSRASPPEIEGKEITTATNGSGNVESERLMACAMGMNGTTIIGVGLKGTMWIWKIRI